MELTSALYYPHSMIRSGSLLKNALLLWDFVECITPTRRLPVSRSRDFTVATELVVRPRVPTPDEKQTVHAHLKDILKDGVPDWLKPDVAPSLVRTPYLMYPEKLASDTWHLLKDADLAHFDQQTGDYGLPQALGLFTLSLLAEECAGRTRTKVTDRNQAYAWLFSLMTQKLGGQYLPALEASHLSAIYDRLITASVRVANTDGIPLKRLLRLREKEEKGQAPELQPLRAKYLAKINEHVQALLQPNLKESDSQEIERQFERDMNSDFSELKKELGFAAKEALFSKEVGICTVAVAGATVASVLAPAAVAPAVTAIPTALTGTGVGALFLTKAKYRKAREKALQGHAMSWLYVTSKRRLL